MTMSDGLKRAHEDAMAGLPEVKKVPKMPKVKAPRKTAAVKHAEAVERRVQQERERLTQLAKEYPERLMKNLARATKLYFTLRVEDNEFVVSGLNEYNDEVTHRLVLEPRNNELVSLFFADDLDRMESFEYFLNDAEYRAAEAERKSRLRTEALAKLSKEEREVLGL
jgi:hypothetical protein